MELAQDADAKRMEGRYEWQSSAFRNKGTYPFAHFSRRLIGKRDGKDRVGSNPLLYQMGDAVCDRFRLAGTRPRDDQEWSFGMQSRFFLLVVEVVEV